MIPRCQNVHDVRCGIRDRSARCRQVHVGDHCHARRPTTELNQEQQGGFNLCDISTARRTATRVRRLRQGRGVNRRTDLDTRIQDAKALEDNAKEPKTPGYTYARMQSGVASTSVREREFVRMNIACQRLRLIEEKELARLMEAERKAFFTDQKKIQMTKGEINSQSVRVVA